MPIPKQTFLIQSSPKQRAPLICWSLELAAFPGQLPPNQFCILKNVKRAQQGFPGHSEVLGRQQESCAGLESPPGEDKDGLCPSASQPEGGKQSPCERRKVSKGKMEPENKALLLSHSLKLCVKNQTPIILEEKLLRIPFYL